MTPAHSEHGAVTVWLLGLVIAILMLGGVSLDLWRAVAARAEVAAVADAAALSASAGIDENLWRTEGRVAISPRLAEQRASEMVALRAGGDHVVGRPVVAVAPDGSSVTVVLAGRMDLSLLRLLVPDQALEFSVSTSASPRVVP